MFYQLSTNDNWGECIYSGLSSTQQSQICFTKEAFIHAQSSLLINIIFTQIFNNLIFRTKSKSILTHLLDNWSMNISYLLQVTLIILLFYTPGINTFLGLRAIRAEFCSPCIGIIIVYFLFSEFTKFLIRKSKENKESKLSFMRYLFY